jgi:hypothetical protein
MSSKQKETGIRKPSTVRAPGTRGIYAGFPATVLRHYDGNMYEVRVPGGVTCIDIKGFIPAT